MKYLSLALLAMLLISSAVGCDRRSEEGPVVVKVNERAITADEFRKELKRSEAMDPEFAGTPDEKAELADELVTRELLIQEAMRQGLDSDESFRRRIRKYYEQTLIESLMKAEARGMTIDVSDDEIKERYEKMGKVFRMDVAQVEAPGSPGVCLRADDVLWKKITGAECRFCHKMQVDQDMEVTLDYLPKDFSKAVEAIAPGKIGGPVLLQGKFCYVKLRGVENLSLPPFPEIREQIRDEIVKEKQAERMEQWLKGLREKADVTVNLDALK